MKPPCLREVCAFSLEKAEPIPYHADRDSPYGWGFHPAGGLYGRRFSDSVIPLLS